MNEYECITLELVMRYLDVAQAHLLLEQMDGVPRIRNARRSLAMAEEEVAKAHQAQTEAQAVVQSAGSEVMLIGSRLKPNARRVSERKAGATEARKRVPKGHC
jgi:rubrerythrin